MPKIPFKAKTHIKPSKDFEESKDEMKKPNKVKVIFARIPSSDYMKLGIELKRKDISLQQWLLEKIGEIK